jgi:hypothetical protein
VRTAADAIVIALSIAAAGLVMVAAQTNDQFTAKASIKGSNSSATADVTISVTRYSSEQERAALIKAAQGTGAQQVLAGLNDAGYIQIGERRTPIKYAFRTATESGELVTVATAVPIVYLGAGLPDAKPTAGFDIAVAILDVKKGGGTGELAPGAKLTMEPSGALKLQDYGSTVVWLNGLQRTKG